MQPSPPVRWRRSTLRRSVAANVGVGRNIAGVHYPSDYAESLKLGEAVAISLLRESGDTYSEPLTGLVFTKFDGTRVRV